MMRAYKAFTHDLRSPIQGGEPIWTGELPFSLPRVAVDKGEADCAAGWNACRSPQTAVKIAGLWPNGWPVRVFVLESRLNGLGKLKTSMSAVLAVSPSTAITGWLFSRMTKVEK